jgi:hypothetical protein
MKLNIQLFAVTKSTSFSESVDKVNNRSNLSITIKFSANNSSTWFNSKSLKCTCNGEEQSKTVSLSKGGKVSATFTFSNIQHNDDGKKSVSWSWSIATGTSVLGTLSDSGTRTLTTIPRASDITASNADIGSSTIIVINKKASSFTTTIDYKFENETSWTNIVTKTSSTTYGWTLPESFYLQIPNKKYGIVTLRAITYDGDTKIGEKTTTFNAFANEELCKPVISNVGAIDTCEDTVLLTGDNTKFIKYESAPMLSWNVSPKNGASIISQKVNVVETVSPYSPLNWSDLYKLVVTDSRGYQTTYDFNLSVIDYFYPQITASGKRKTSTSSNIILNVTGKFFNDYFSDNIKNTATFKCNYKKKDDSGWSTITLTPTINADGTFTLTDFDLGGICDYKYSWQFSISVMDKLFTQRSNFAITKGDPVYYWYIKDRINYFRVKGKLKADTEIKIGEKKVLGFNEVEGSENTYKLITERITSDSISHKINDNSYEDLNIILNKGTICVKSEDGNKSYNVTKSWTNYNIPVVDVIKNNESKLTLENGKLVNKTNKTLLLLVSANILVLHPTNDTDKELAIAKNDSNVISAYGIAAGTKYSSITISPFILELSPEDKISLNMRFGATGTVNVSSEGTYLTVIEL